MEYTIRNIKENEIDILEDFLYKQVSLAVQKANYAVKMYKKAGFEIVDENDEEYIMVCTL